MTNLPEIGFASEEPREVTLYLRGNDDDEPSTVRFPIREMDRHLLTRAITGNSTITIEFHDRFCVIPIRSILYFEVSKEDYQPDEDDEVFIPVVSYPDAKA